MIRTSKHYFHLPNKQKYNKLIEFISEYNQTVQYFIDYIWLNHVNDKLNSPNMLSTKNHKIGKLSQRAIKCAATQACSIVKGTLDLQKRRIYILRTLTKDTNEYNKLNEIIKNTKINKPNINNVSCELNSICANIIKRNNFWLLNLTSLGKYYGKIALPFKLHKQANKWKDKGNLKGSFLVNNKRVELRWEIEVPKLKTVGDSVGVDQGSTTCLSLSNKEVTSCNNHGYDLTSIQKILARRKKGSRNFCKSQEHRKNYINWSINKLNLDNVKELKIEGIKNVRKGKKCSRESSHWAYTLIKDKLLRLSEELGVQASLQSSPYRSQRCSSCGLVLKSNRKKKLYSCSCGYTEDSDINAANNHEAELISLPVGLSHLGINNIDGFYWNSSGVFDLNGKEITVPNTVKSY